MFRAPPSVRDQMEELNRAQKVDNERDELRIAARIVLKLPKDPASAGRVLEHVAAILRLNRQ